jgi:glucose-1-phosphate cytidylyltransferase
MGQNYVDGPCILTYGDGVADIDLYELEKVAMKSKKLVTVTAVHPPGRFGALTIENNRLVDFKEKPLGEDWVNGGFWYLEPEAFEYFRPDEMLEQGGIQRLMAKDQVAVYRHEGFWHPMDTRRDMEYLEGLWERNEAPWRNWK